MRVVIINGIGGAGKDQFVKFCQDLLGTDGLVNRCLNVSTVDYVKEVAGYCGWSGEKDPASRKFLSDLKKAMTEWRDLPVMDIKGRLNHYSNICRWNGVEETVAFVHCREPEEIARLVDELNATTLLIRRESAENVKQINDSDNNVLNYSYDYVVRNEGTLDDLKESARVFLTECLGLNI
jgi:hypothetical protein